MASPRDLRALPRLFQGLTAPRFLGAVGLGLLFPAFFSLAAVRFGGFIVPAALALAAFGFAGPGGAAGALLALWAMPVVGIHATLLAGAALFFYFFEKDERPDDWSAAFAAAAWLCWAKLLSLLLDDPLWAVCGLGAAAALAPVRFAHPALAGGLGALGLAFLRLLALNASEPERLQIVAGGWHDALFLGLQSFVAALLWLAASGARGRRGPSVAAGAALGALGAHFLGAAPAALLFHAAQAAWGAPRLLKSFRPGLLLLAMAFALAWPARHLLRDAWLTRLNAAYPGGEWLSLSDEGGRYRFSTGAEVLVEGGRAREPQPDGGRADFHLLASAHPAPRKALLLGDFPGADSAAQLHGVELERKKGDPRRVLRACKERYDLIMVEPAGGRLRRLETRQFHEELRRCLTDNGVAAAGEQYVGRAAVERVPGRLTAAMRLEDPDLGVKATAPVKQDPAAYTDDKPFGPSLTSRNLYNLRR